jgi:SAM-dependent methyltransferase
MSVGPEVFGEDYLYFYEPRLTDEVSDQQADLLWRVLALREGDEVLDLACGHGRIASRLAARGASVTGLDADAFFLERARAAGGGDVEYLHGDMRELPWREPRFDAVVLWFTAFGYFDDATNLDVLRGIRRVLRQGGRLAMDINHLPRLLATMHPQQFLRRENDVALDEYDWHPARSVMTTRRTYIRGGEAREISYDVRMYMPAELRGLLLDAGFADVDLLGIGGDPLTADARRLLAVARAPS